MTLKTLFYQNCLAFTKREANVSSIFSVLKNESIDPFVVSKFIVDIHEARFDELPEMIKNFIDQNCKDLDVDDDEDE